MLKILQITNKAPFPPDDGSSIAVYNMAKGFIENACELHLLAINTKKHFKPDSNVPHSFRTQSNYTSVFHNTNTSPGSAFLNLFSSSSYFESRFRFKKFEKQLIAKLKQTQFDIIQLEGLFVAGYIELIRKYSKAKIVLRAHNVEYKIWERHVLNTPASLKQKYLKLQLKRLKQFELNILQKVDAIVAISEPDAQTFRALSQKNVFTCLTGVNPTYYTAGRKEEVKKDSVFYFASMDWIPNQEAVDWFLEKCWTKIHKAVPGCKFIIAGKNIPPRFQKMNYPNVLCIENVRDSKTFYQQHSVMVVPLLSGSGIRIKIIEGMAYGKAIVSTSIGAEGIAVRSGQHLLIRDEAEAFAGAVIELLTNELKREDLQKEARAFAIKEFDNKKIADGLIQFYRSLNV